RAELSEIEKSIVSRVEQQLRTTVDELATSVDIDSSTENFQGLRELADFYAERFEDIGFETEWVALPESTGRAGHFVAIREGAEGPRILLIGHLDTVLEGERWRIEDQVAYGSGTADMKGGNQVILAALRALDAEGLLDDRRLAVFFTGDEESPGEPVSVVRSRFIDEAKRSDIALAYETAVGDTAVIGRRGIITWELEVRGQTGHSSGIFSESRGSGAIFEAARILDSFHNSLKEPNVTFNASVIVGGTDVEFESDKHAGRAHGKTNVVPQRVVAYGDLRFLTAEQRERATAKMASIVAIGLPRTSAKIEFFEGYPPMAPTEGNLGLLRQLDQVSRDLGYGGVTAYDPAKRGAGDISFVAEYVDALDGLGVHGFHTHAPGESLDLSTLKQQISRTAVLIYRLTR
ncbi:MAG: M20/M25/M40 family metallo-hydrolase, partial [Acidobacteria bacterium]|nr:M20/M25/M40 family metallo-hydrolase [Acidobacteriota bacterium]